MSMWNCDAIRFSGMAPTVRVHEEGLLLFERDGGLFRGYNSMFSFHLVSPSLFRTCYECEALEAREVSSVARLSLRGATPSAVIP